MHHALHLKLRLPRSQRPKKGKASYNKANPATSLGETSLPESHTVTIWRQKQRLSASQLMTWSYAAVCSGSSCWGQSQLRSALQLTACHNTSPLSWENIKSCSSPTLSQTAPKSWESKALLRLHAVTGQHPCRPGCCGAPTSTEASSSWTSTLLLLTVPPWGNLPCKALMRCITCIRLYLPQCFHKLQHSPASIFHPWRKEVKRVNQKDSQTVSQARRWRWLPGRVPALQRERLTGCRDLAKHRRSHVHLVGGAASSPACKQVWDCELPRLDQS